MAYDAAGNRTRVDRYAGSHGQPDASEDYQTVTLRNQIPGHENIDRVLFTGEAAPGTVTIATTNPTVTTTASRHGGYFLGSRQVTVTTETPVAATITPPGGSGVAVEVHARRADENRAYDGFGNPTAIGGEVLAYDGESRPVRVQVGNTRIRYLYDYLGRRSKEWVENLVEGVWTTAREEVLIHDGMQVLARKRYEPHQGRFLTEDPIGVDGGANLYGYLGNRAFGAWDAWGWSSRYMDGGGYDYDDRNGSGFIPLYDGPNSPCLTLGLCSFPFPRLESTGSSSERDDQEGSEANTGLTSPAGQTLGRIPLLGLVLGPLADAISGVGNLASGRFGLGMRKLFNAIRFVGDRILDDAGSIGFGLIANAYGLAEGATKAAWGVVTLNPSRVSGGFATFKEAMVLRYGTTSGPNHGVGHKTLFWPGAVGMFFRNLIEFAAFNHDTLYDRVKTLLGRGQISQEIANRHFANLDRRFISDLFSSSHPQPGPVGQLYRLAAAPVFTIKSFMLDGRLGFEIDQGLIDQLGGGGP